MNCASKETLSLDAFVNQLHSEISPSQIIDDYLSRSALGSDASFYHLVPALIVQVDSLAELRFLVVTALRFAIPLTFRAAGTSLSGQAVTDSVLVMLTASWRTHDIYRDGLLIRLDPGLTGGEANRFLEKYSRKIGPDPASITSAKIGGIAANNASGMCCGTKNNSYKTLAGLSVVLPDGAFLNTLDEFSRDEFRHSHADLLKGLIDIREQILCDKTLLEKISKKYEIKNTTGYSLNAFTDYSDAIDIFQHLIIGSEGTLGFIASITYETVEDFSHQASALVIFDSIQDACEKLSELRALDVSAVELIDGAGLLATAHMAGFPVKKDELSINHAALLIDVKAQSDHALEKIVDQVLKCFEKRTGSCDAKFTFDKEDIGKLWAIRKGLFPAISKLRPSKTTVIIEDVAFPFECLAQGVTDTQQLLVKYRYKDAAIFGHALDGNIHFVFSQEFNTDKEIQKYREFMDELSLLVVGQYGGSLKAEHGTGRNIAPFVEMEWGSRAYDIMQRLKSLIDPKGIFNPGVILNNDKLVHIKNLKDIPVVSKIIDSCIECGFCEPTCPSRDLSFTPRSRIAALREIARVKASNLKVGARRDLLDEMQKSYRYLGDETCAACGLCEISCPAEINMGDMSRTLRAAKRNWGSKVAATVANNFQLLCTMIRIALSAFASLYRLLGESWLSKMSGLVSSLSFGLLPSWNRHFPRSVNKRDFATDSNPSQDARKVVYFSSCVSRTMGVAVSSCERRSIPAAMLAVLERANFTVIFPENIDSLCCGMPMDSKGFPRESQMQGSQLVESLVAASDGGSIPVICDTSPCSQQIEKRLKEQHSEVSFYDATSFLNTEVLPRLNIKPVSRTVALHTVCSAERMGVGADLYSIADQCANDVVRPASVSCCGFAGDKGFTVPELNASALASLETEVAECIDGYSSSKTCEIGLSLHSGIEYKNIVYLVDEASAS